ncbi:chemotaxis protein CheW [Clostridium sediminicola]|uniref:chemotaxis protein CheW n=1 Tax=Clostridium sediminicola TaxID=3114879 RepID=UPI0031F23FDB
MRRKNIEEQFEQNEDTQKGKFLTFSLGKELYGIGILHVTEIVGIQPVTEVPELPEYIKGIINLRGNIIPVMDVRVKFKKNVVEYNDRTCIIVIDTGKIAIGLIVDEVSEVLSIPDKDIISPPKINKSGKKYIKNIGKIENNIILILDCEKLLDEEVVDSLSNL